MDNKQKTITNLKKAKTHIEKIISMVEWDIYCVNIMQQNLAVIGLLKSAHQMLMEWHLNCCFKKAIESKNKNRHEEMVQEILQVTKLLNK